VTATSVAEREASATTKLATRVLANQIEIARIAVMARLALTIARRARPALPLWLILTALVSLDVEIALLIFR
jgi:hypothetical protein